MEDKIINIKVQHNLTETTESTNKLSKAINDTSKATNELSSGSEKLKSLQGGINGIGDAVGGLNPAIGTAVKATNGLIAKMWEIVANPVGAVIAALVAGLGFLYSAFTSSVAGGKELKQVFAGLTATITQIKDAVFGFGRALIDLTIASYKFLTLDFKGGAEAMKKANNEASESYKQLGNAVDGTTFKIVANLEKQQQANDKARKIASVEDSKANMLLVKSRELLTDEEASLTDKRKALEEVTKVEKAASDERIRIAKEDLRIKKEKAQAIGGEEAKKMQQEIREAQTEVNNAIAEGLRNEFKLNKQRRQFDKQETQEQKEEQDKRTAQAKEAHDKDLLELQNKLKEEGKTYDQRRKMVMEDTLITNKERDKLINDINQEEIKAKKEHLQSLRDLEKKYFDDLQTLNAKTEQEKLDLQASRELLEIQKVAKTANEKANLMSLYNEKYILLNQELADKQKIEDEKNAKARLDALFKELDDDVNAQMEASDRKIQIAKLEAKAKSDQIDSYGNALSSLSTMLDESTTAGKVAAVASATISTYSSANKAYESQLSIPTPDAPIRATIAAGIAVASGLLNVQKILSVKTKGGGGSAPSGGTSAPSAPSFNVVGNSGQNQIAQVMNKQGMPPIKTYVTAGDVTTQQSLNRNIINNSTIG